MQSFSPASLVFLLRKDPSDLTCVSKEISISQTSLDLSRYQSQRSQYDLKHFSSDLFYSSKLCCMSVLPWQLSESLSMNVYDNVNVFSLGGIDLLHCCCCRASTETCYWEYINRLWACKKYCCCTYNIYEITP